MGEDVCGDFEDRSARNISEATNLKSLFAHEESVVFCLEVTISCDVGLHPWLKSVQAGIVVSNRYLHRTCCAGFHRVNNKCEECPVGKLGKDCEDDCPPGYYGRLCADECICSGNESCSPFDGACRISNSSGDDGGTASYILSHPYFVIITFSVCVTVIVVAAMVLFRKKLLNFDNSENRVDRRPSRSQKSTTSSRVKSRQSAINSSMADGLNVYAFARESEMCPDEMFEDTTKENKNTRGSGFSLLSISKEARGTSGGETSRAVMGMDGYHFMEIVPGREGDTHI